MLEANRKPRGIIISTIEKVMKKAYIQATETGFRSEWRKIVGWVDQEVIKDQDISQTEIMERVKNESEHILKFLSHWYNKIYLKENVAAFVDLALEVQLGNHIVSGSIPIIRAFEFPAIIILSDVVRNEWELYNDIEIRGLGWLALQALQVSNLLIDCLTIGPNGGFITNRVKITEETSRTARKMIKDITKNIGNGQDYPSVTSKCQTCPFQRRCII